MRIGSLTVYRLIFATCLIAMASCGVCDDSISDSTVGDEPDKELSYELLTNDNAPDSVLFWHFLESIYVDQSLANGATRRILAPGITPESDPDFLAAHFLELYLSVDKEIRQAKNVALNCDDPTYSPAGAALSRVMNGLDRIELSIYEKQLAISSVQLDSSFSFDLLTAIRNSPSSFQQFVTVRPDTPEITDGDARIAFETLCKSFEGGLDHDVRDDSDVIEHK